MFFRKALLSFGAAGFLLTMGSAVRADYEDEVLSDEPVAYWRLGEDDPLLPAENLGSGLDALNGIYTGGVLLEEDGLISDDPDTAAAFDGIDAQVDIPDSSLTNLGGPFERKTIELWFQADIIDTEPRILFEEGGTTNGFSVYVQEVDGDPLLLMAAWAGGRGWRPSVGVSAEIEEGVIYHAVMVFDASENEEFGDFDGRVTGYLDGEEFDTQIGADLMHQHTDDTAIGAAKGQTKLLDDTEIRGGGQLFQGTIDEVAVYNSLLDDPDDDGDFSDSRVLDHFEAGAGTGAECPRGLAAARDGGNVKLTWETRGAPTSVRVVRNGTELAAAAPVDPPEYVDTTATPGELLYELTFDLPDCRTLRRRFQGCITDIEASSTLDGIALTWVNNFAYTNIVIQRGDEEIATIAGDQESYLDPDPPPGTSSYSVFPENGDCEPVSAGVTRGEVLGTGTASLLGDDLTDRDDDGDELLYNPPDDLGNFDAVFFSSDEPGFGGGEFAFNVFDNILGPSNDKWCCGTTAPQIVGADFSEIDDTRYRLTHFTISSANDVPDRDPRVWRIEGSSDGEEWTTIFEQDDPDAALWTERLQVILFQEGVDYEEQTEGYVMFRMVTDATGLPSGNYFQIGEIEFFGEEGDAGAPRTVFHRGDTDGDGTITLTDAVTTLAFLFSGGEDTTCKETQDFNNDANVDLTDAVGVLSFLFSGGDAPAAPGPTTEPCGPDPDPEGSAGDLGCASYNGC